MCIKIVSILIGLIIADSFELELQLVLLKLLFELFFLALLLFIMLLKTVDK